ncbi:isochorismatase family protein [Xenorhabdus sp. KK7.4]|uniref:isochorismatase family protein n=1 Tax=Xenorhabdus sp. KK7.4 TaxID=1851572 RepID=UPI000C052E42|nr:isochorismatase family protein [Xenorhabdus sp. KK7.4]PHM59005.1 2,3-dihydro-2,3-dihydroxybenzoate synthetase [Xenorhabdus sp. KK7.4]
MSIPKLQDYTLPDEATLPVNKVEWRLEPQRAALLIHDMQEYFLNFWGKESKMVQQVINNIVILRARCHELGIPVFYTAQPDQQSDVERALLNDMWGPGLNRYPEQQKIAAALAPEQQDTVLVKWRYSAFQRSDLETHLKERQRDQLIICGVYAHIGCLTTATDAFMRDIQAFMISDALADFSREEHMMALRYTAGRSGQVLSTDMALSALDSPATENRWDRDRLLTILQSTLDEDVCDIDDDENLLDYGLDSLRMMSFVSKRRLEGYELDFTALMKQPTLRNWLVLLNDELEAR